MNQHLKGLYIFYHSILHSKAIKKTLFFLIFTCFSLHGISQACTLDLNFRQTIKLPACQEKNGEISISNVSGGVPPYRFFLGDQSNNSGLFSSLGIGIYQLVISDATACTDSVEIRLIPDPNKKYFYVPNAFSPNNDGINDQLIISGLEKHRGVSFTLYNKWGQELIRIPDYRNEYAWNGTQNGNNLFEGTYYYVITLLVDCREVFQNGTITIVR